MTEVSSRYDTCPLCGSDCSRLVFQLETLPCGRPAGVVRCETCGLVYQNTRRRPDSQRGFYESGYYPAAVSPDWKAGREALFMHYLKTIAPFRKNNRILDIGAGHGFFLKLCRDQGWECRGIEPARPCVEYAKREFGFEFFSGSLKEAGFPDSCFDVVTLWNVLDQLEDPAGTLAEIHRVLRPVGGLFLRFPNGAFHIACRRIFLALGRIWPRARFHDPSVFHCFSFERKTIHRLLEQQGFSEIRIYNSKLCGGLQPGQEAEMRSKVFTRFSESVGAVVSFVSAGRWLVAPSLFVTAVKGSSVACRETEAAELCLP